MSCRSLIRLSIPTRSTTLNQPSLPTSCRALITHISPPCVTAELSFATPSLGLRCPVLSLNWYTAIVIFSPSIIGTSSNLFWIGECCTVGDVFASSSTCKLGPIAHPPRNAR